MRRVVLPSGQIVILSDTVGFISDLPTDLVAAFRATLEEVLEADLILHIRDAAHPDSRAQQADVAAILADLGVAESSGRVQEVLNKADLLNPEQRTRLSLREADAPATVLCSALTGEGSEAVLAMIDQALSAKRLDVALSLPLSEGAALSWLYDHGEVLAREDDGLTCRVEVKISRSNLDRGLKKFSQLVVIEPEYFDETADRAEQAEKHLQSS